MTSRDGIHWTRWPGGDLLLNLDASAGEAKVRVSGERRAPIAGFDYEDCDPIAGADGTRLRVRWDGESMEQLLGQVVRIEIFLQGGDLYGLQAGEGETINPR